MLFDERFSILERRCQNSLSHSQVEDEEEKENNDVDRPFMWGMWQFDNEVTLLLEEEDIDKFPPGSLTISPQRWRIVKLAGRPIAFDETGVVSMMSKTIDGVASLNISTVTTNATLVPDEVLQTTVNTLSRILQCPVRGMET